MFPAERANLRCTCTSCGRVYIYRHRKGHTKLVCNSCRSNNVVDRIALKQRMVDYKGGKCQLCGYAQCLAALHFHHLDPQTKLFHFAGSHLRRWEALQKELDKCILLCSNCHKEVENGYAAVPPEIAAPILTALRFVPRRKRRRPGRPASDDLTGDVG